MKTKTTKTNTKTSTMKSTIRGNPTIIKETNNNSIKNPIINILINILKSFARIFNKFTPILWFMELFFTIKGITHSFFTSFKIIRESFEYLNKLPVFKLLRNIIRILSIVSLIFNLLILGIFTQFSIFNWVYSVPAVSQIGAFIYDSSPEKAQGFLLWVSLKIKTFLLWIWSGIIDFIKTVIKIVLGEIENSPNTDIPTIDPDKGKYGDIHNDRYMSKFKETIYNWRFWLLGGFIIIGVGAAAYLYWDSISGCWKRREYDDSPGDPFIPLPMDSEIHGPNTGTIPSPDSSNSGGSFERYFRNPLVDRLSKFRNKVGNYLKGKSIDRGSVGPIPRGIYQVDGRNMYNGLPIPRTELLGNGTEYYYNLDKYGFINVLSNKFSNNNDMELLNPFSGKGISRTPISIRERIALINKARDSAICDAPLNSYSRNQIFDGVVLDISQPSLSNLPSASTSMLPNLEDAEHLSDIDLTPRARTIPLKTDNVLDLENPFSE